MSALLAVLLTMCAAPAAAQPDGGGMPVLIAETRWDSTSMGRTLRVYPTPLGRTYAAPDGADIAWAEVVALAPDAQSPGMRMQFDCHWYGRAFIPDKPSWNLEPWRPPVDEGFMALSQCNPGGPEV
ncbi:MAG: DUF2599 domain-containing protein [Mycobacterium sp.]